MDRLNRQLLSIALGTDPKIRDTGSRYLAIRLLEVNLGKRYAKVEYSRPPGSKSTALPRGVYYMEWHPLGTDAHMRQRTEIPTNSVLDIKVMSEAAYCHNKYLLPVEDKIDKIRDYLAGRAHVTMYPPEHR